MANPNITLVDTFTENLECYYDIRCTFCDKNYKFRGQTNDVINRHLDDFATHADWYSAKQSYVHDDNDAVFIYGLSGDVSSLFCDDEEISKYDGMTIVYWHNPCWIGQCAFTGTVPFGKNDVMCGSCFQNKKNNGTAFQIWIH